MASSRVRLEYWPGTGKLPRPGRAVLCVALILSGLATPATASPRTEAASRLEAAEQQRVARTEQEAAAARDLAAAQIRAGRLAAQRLQAALALRTIEADVGDAAERLKAASAGQASADAELARREAAFATLLPLMLRLSRYPVETVLAVPVPAAPAMEGLLITRGLAAQFNQEAVALRDQQVRAARLREETARRAAALAAARAAQQSREVQLDQIVAQTQAQVSGAEAAGRAAAQAVASLAAQAQTLRGAIAAMDAAAAREAARAAREAAAADRRRQPVAARAARAREAALTPPAGPALAHAAGQLMAPVAGPVSRAFGAPAEDGPATGMTFAAAPDGFVSSPCAGRVAFAAPFRSYGQLLILECGGGYDVVLAGLGRIDVAPGHLLVPGDPVGRMPGATPHPGVATPGLYVELRAHGQPVNPAPFLAPFRNLKG